MSRVLDSRGQLEKQLDLLARRPDLPIGMRIRVHLLKLIEKDTDWIWEQYKAHVMFGEKGSEPRARLLTALLDKLLVTQRDVTSTEAAPPPAPPMIVNITGLDRGSSEKQVTVSVERADTHEQITVSPESP